VPVPRTTAEFEIDRWTKNEGDLATETLGIDRKEYCIIGNQGEVGIGLKAMTKFLLDYRYDIDI